MRKNGNKLFSFSNSLWVYIMMVYHPMYNCRREYETLLYPSACLASCESEHDQRRYNNDYFG
jgi:hypothetical protein